MMHDWYTGWGGGGMGFGSVFMIVPLVLLIVVVVLLVRWAGGSRGESPRESARSAREILDERFARGEIDDEEYRRRRKLLET